ncbi:hypothetical protein G7048_01020 [Diaphorobacter sp. HDW4B]|uniref:hypothetical protein n=1 Tax=Diaphorobacter sp. HDW4B TaxID=2714925 RepID=UPI001407DEBD|nr:hypothetical protein [Diaphorobacter sp. HDW4B]QIL69098.1 hypothetical protein G7048_01020 [Diaphorobacter sp. HDW4B]
MTAQVESVAAAATSEVAPVLTTPAVKVMVIDDELAGLTYAHLTDHTANIAQVFGDLTSPEIEELWPIVMHIKSFPSLDEEEPVKALAYLSSTEFVRDVLLSDYFRNNATPLLTGPLAGFLERAAMVADLRSQVEKAFPAPEFETTFASARPSQPLTLLQYDFLILDLVLHKSAGAVDEIVDYLMEMGNVTYPAPLPCIVVMSNSDELMQERLRFSTESNISAAGLLLLPKAEIRRKDFGAPGLTLCYQQLFRQRDVAQHMRVFMRSWMKALETAREKANVALWNLDAGAMQEIHLSAFTDNDPYDEHLNELMAREYLWHVESSPSVGKAIEALDTCFQQQFKKAPGPPTIGQRFIAPFVKSKAGRDLVSHFTWTGFSVPEALDSVDPAEALKKFNRLVPFGAVLAPENLSPDTECLVHITQQCDLNAATRPEKLANPVQTAQFAVALPIEVIENRMPAHKTEDLVARGLIINGKEYDLRLVKGRQLALLISKFIDYAAKEGLHVVGRLRHDIATHFLSATANHMTRFASLRTTRIEVRNVRLFLYGKKFPEGKPLPWLNTETQEPLVVQVAKHNNLHFFQDDMSMRIALWIGQQLSTYYAANDIDASVTCNALSVGLNNKQGLVKFVDFVYDTFALADLAKKLPAAEAPDPKVRLVVVEAP